MTKPKKVIKKVKKVVKEPLKETLPVKNDGRFKIGNTIGVQFQKGGGLRPGAGMPLLWDDERIELFADYFLEFVETPEFIFFKEFCLWIKEKTGDFFSPIYFARFSGQNEKFRTVLEYAKVVQESKIVKGGLTRGFDSQMSKFMLCAVHHYTDRQIVAVEGQVPVSVISYSDTKQKTYLEEKNEKDK